LIYIRTIRLGDKSPHTDLLQTALTRAGFITAADGAFGGKTENAVKRFQATRGLSQDGIVGNSTWSKLLPYLLGYRRVTVSAGDTLYRIAAINGTTVEAIQIANKNIDPNDLVIGSELIVPFSFDVTPTNIRWSSLALALCADGISARYPDVTWTNAGTSVLGRDLLCAAFGNGYAHQVFYNASHHANEWITTPLLVNFLEQYAKAVYYNKEIFQTPAADLFAYSRLYMMPLVNPDGVDLVNGDIVDENVLTNTKRIAGRYPNISYPAGWKANISGIDPNLQYPAQWEKAREIKFAQGFTTPAPRDFVGDRVLQIPESNAVRNSTLGKDFKLTLSYHTQGRVIYWKYSDFEPAHSKEIGEVFAAVSGYELSLTPADSSYAGYKDWFIQTYDRPGYTVEVGQGTAPLPISQFDKIWNENLGILTLGLTINL